ncbi:MAG: hypothetical protein IJX24_07590 [Oscillospiraceae bacterium]|nr:hypothetical protein [Oscillospiraceae bacterium]
MTKIAVLNSKNQDAALIFSLVRYNMEYQANNHITVFSAAEALQNAVNQGNEYDLFFMYPDDNEENMSELAEHISSIKADAEFVFLSSPEVNKIGVSDYLTYPVSYEKITEYLNRSRKCEYSSIMC